VTETYDEWREWFEGRLPETSSNSSKVDERLELEGRSAFTGCPTWKRGRTMEESNVQYPPRTPRPGPPEGQDYFSMFQKHGRPRGPFEER
jgi:hypothetical protein